MTVPGLLPAARPGPARPAVQARSHSTAPCGVDRLPCLIMEPYEIDHCTGTGSSLAAGRPVGYSDGTEDATTVPSAAIATTAVTARSARTGPAIAGTSSVPSAATWTRPGWAGWPRSPSMVPAGTPPG